MAVGHGLCMFFGMTRPDSSWFRLSGRGLGIVVLTVLAGCAGTAGLSEKEELAAYGRMRAQEWAQLDSLKAEVQWQDPKPLVFEFEGHGDVMVSKWRLEGGPGWEYIRARIVYKNTTKTDMDRARIVLKVEDGAGHVVAQSYVDLIHPWGWPLRPGTTFGEEIKVPTQGAHLDKAGWRFVVGCRALPDAAIPF